MWRRRRRGSLPAGSGRGPTRPVEGEVDRREGRARLTADRNLDRLGQPRRHPDRRRHGPGQRAGTGGMGRGPQAKIDSKNNICISQHSNSRTHYPLTSQRKPHPNTYVWIMPPHPGGGGPCPVRRVLVPRRLHERCVRLRGPGPGRPVPHAM